MNVYQLIAEPFWDVLDDVLKDGHTQYWLKGGRNSTKSSFIAITIMASSCKVLGFDKLTSDMLRSLPTYNDMVLECKTFLEKEVDNE